MHKKAKLGRPSKGDDAKVLSVMVKATAKELPEWKCRADAEGMSLGTWVAQPRRDELYANKVRGAHAYYR